jgi:hypothetical protein
VMTMTLLDNVDNNPLMSDGLCVRMRVVCVVARVAACAFVMAMFHDSRQGCLYQILAGQLSSA